MTRRNNSLTHGQSARLYHWIEESRNWCSTTTARQIAVKAAQELGFGITEHNVLHVKRSLNITKPAPVVAAGNNERLLAVELVAIFDHMGVRPSPALLDLAGISRLRAAAEPLPFHPPATPPRVSAECAG